MANIKTLLVNHPGPLPIKIQYTPQADVEETFFFSGSFSTHDLASMPNGIEVKVNGDSVGKSIVYSGQHGAVVHQATVPVMVNYDVPFVIKDGVVQPVTIEVVPASSDSTTDKDDVFNLAIFG